MEGPRGDLISLRCGGAVFEEKDPFGELEDTRFICSRCLEECNTKERYEEV